MALSIRLQDVTKRYGGRAEGAVALKGINLGIGSGEFFTLLGPSGCGKTTTLRLIGGFELPTEGQVFVNGLDITNVPPFRRPVNTVFQSYALFPHLTVEENIAFGLTLKRVAKDEVRQRVTQALRLVKLSEVGSRKPRALSGGQQQRVALARALVNKPSVLLLDEPLGALDLQLRKEMQAELRQMQQELGITFVLVTHDQEEALTMSDRIAVMQGGEILQVGTPGEIYERPATQFCASFIGEMNFLPAVVLSVEGGRSMLSLGPNVAAPGPVAPWASPGDHVTLAIRPEALRVFGDRADNSREAFSVDATVRSQIYRGSERTLSLQLDSGETLAMTVRGVSEGNSVPAVGSRNRIGCDCSSLLIFPGVGGIARAH